MKEEFFYPVECRDGTSLIIGNDKIKSIHSYGVK